MEFCDRLLHKAFGNRFEITTQLANDVKTGDILLFSGTSIGAYIIKDFVDTQWSHVGFIFKPTILHEDAVESEFCDDNNSNNTKNQSFPPHSCIEKNAPVVHTDEAGNMHFELRESKKHVFIERRVDEDVAVRDEIFQACTERHLDGDDDEYGSTWPGNLSRVAYRQCPQEESRLRHSYKQHEALAINNEINPEFRPNWKNGATAKDTCYRCILERYNNVPLLLESDNIIDDGLLDLLTGTTIKNGVRLVSLADRIRTFEGENLAIRQLKYIGTPPRRWIPNDNVGIDSASSKLSKFAIVAQRRLIRDIFPNVRGKSFEEHRLDMIRAWRYGALCFGGENDEDESSFFCSELVVKVFKCIHLLSPTSTGPCDRYAPSDFSSEPGSRLLCHLHPDWNWGPEIYLSTK